ncbi:MAG: hypothetical protein ACRDG3_13985 [Tepidiformaceae bacterium]
MIRLPIQRVNRIATLAILPLMAIAVVIGSRAVRNNGTGSVPTPHEGLLIVAQLKGEALTTFDLQGTGEAKQLALAGPPHELAVVDGRLYATLEHADELDEIDPDVPAVMRTLPLDNWPHGLAVDGDKLLVTLDKGRTLATIDRATMTDKSSVATGDTPHTVAFAGGTAYVTDSRDNDLRAFAPDGSFKTVPTGALPEAVTIFGKFVITGDADGGTLTVVDRSTFRVVRTIQTGGRPVRVVPLDSDRVLVAMNTSSSILVVNVSTGKIEKSIATNGHPDGICISPSGDYVAVASNEAGTVQIFRLSNWAPAGTLNAGDGLGSCIWIASH